MSRKSKAAEFAQEGYNIDINGRNVLVTETMRDYALEKVSKIDRFTNRIIDVSVMMETQKLDHRCDIILRVDHIVIKSHASTDNMYASIDKAVDKIQTQLRRYKKRIQDHHAKPLEVIDMNVNVIRAPSALDLLDVNEEIEEESNRRTIDQYRPHDIVKQEKLPLKSLTSDEAVMKMELSGNAFLMYKDEQDRKLKVIYRRSDGDYGIIEPEC